MSRAEMPSNTQREGPVFDKIGQHIQVGSIVAYGHALGQCAGIRIGKVLEMYLPPVPDWRARRYDEQIRIKVHGVDDDWNHREPDLCKKTGTLMFPERIIVLDPETIPVKIRRLLDSVTLPPKQ